jgi:hypothetical protein
MQTLKDRLETDELPSVGWTSQNNTAYMYERLFRPPDSLTVKSYLCPIKLYYCPLDHPQNLIQPCSKCRVLR